MIVRTRKGPGRGVEERLSRALDGRDKTREIIREKWLRAHEQARRGPVPTTTPTVAEYLAYWLAEVVEVGSRPSTYAMYEAIARLYVVPMLGPKRIDRLTVRDVRTWLNRVAATCRCCALGKDSGRDPGERRCCAIGVCCRQVPSRRTVQAVRNVLRAAINTAMSEELVQRNVAALVKVPSPARRRRASWAVEDARRFLEHARQANDPLYAAYILCLVLGLRRGEVLGLTWPNVGFDRAEVVVGWQLLRVRGELIHTETKTDASDAVLPLPEICLTALKLRQQAQAIDREQAGDAWTDTDLVFTTRWGTPIEPRNFYRSFQRRRLRAGVPPIRVHDTPHLCLVACGA
jgi:integrase